MVLRLASHAMGTRFELVLAGDDDLRLRAAGEAALHEIEQVDRQLSLFRRDSLLAHLNRSAHTRPVRLDADTFELFVTADEVVRASGGAFDPTVAPLLRALGLHDEQVTTPLRTQAEARASVGWSGAVVLDRRARSVRFRRPAQLDLGGIAKGHGLDLAASVLRECGVTLALLHGGTSTVVALGAPPDRPGWRVSVGPGQDAPLALLCDRSLSVSAPAGRVARHGDRDVHHVIDPRSGTSSEGARLAAVIAPCATRADAWSTALLVAPDLTPPAGVEALVRDVSAPARWRHAAPAHARFTRVPPTPTPA